MYLPRHSYYSAYYVQKTEKYCCRICIIWPVHVLFARTWFHIYMYMYIIISVTDPASCAMARGAGPVAHRGLGFILYRICVYNYQWHGPAHRRLGFIFICISIYIEYGYNIIISVTGPAPRAMAQGGVACFLQEIPSHANISC